MVQVIIWWIGLSAGVAWFAGARGRSTIAFLVLSLLLTPFVGLLILLIAGGAAPGPAVCHSCGAYGKLKTHTPGNLFLEVVLWALLLVPGLIYSLWRITHRERVCGACGAPVM